MEKQQTLRGARSGADSSSPTGEGQKSMAAQPRADAPHRILDLRNRITAGQGSPPSDGSRSTDVPRARPPKDTGSKG